MKHHLTLLFCLLGCLALFAEDVPENLFPDQSFRSWSATAERHLTPNGGQNGAPGLVVERKDPQVFDFKMEKIQYPMKPNTRYEISYEASGRDISNLKLGAGVRMEFQLNGQWAGAFMRRGLYGTSDWKTFRFEVTTPAEFDAAYIGFFMGMPFRQPENQLGYAVFCHPVLRELKPIWRVDLLNPPMKRALRAGKNRLIFTHAVIGKLDKMPETVTVTCTGATNFKKEVPAQGGRFIVECDLDKGDSTMELQYGEFTRAIGLTAGLPLPENAILIDDKGRVTRNGKPFLPVCLNTNQACPPLEKLGYVTTEEDIRLFLESPFNVYSEALLTRMRFEGESAGRWGEVTEKTIANALKLMDRAYAAGKLVCIPGRLHSKIKILDAQGPDEAAKLLVKIFASHPATLMWVINDEADVNAEEMRKRDLFSRLDPFHPSYQVQYKVDAYDEAIGGGDIFTMDNYPIYDENSDMEIIAKSMDAMQKHFSFNGGRIACWAVIQAFNWNNYNKTAPYYFPKEEQIRATLVLLSLSGIKGFRFYQRQWLRDGVDHDGYLKRWQMLCRLAQMLRDLEPYLLSDQEHPQFTLKVLKGHVRAQTFRTNDGKLALLVANAGKGEGIAEITFPGGEKLESQYGLTKLENGKWLFKGTNAAGDVIK